MKPFTLKLYRPDEENRDALIAHYSDLWGRKAPLAEILRELMAEKVAAISNRKNS
jgi:hypothetical protein